MKPRKRAYSRYTKQAILLLGRHIRVARLTKKITERDLADRIGVSRATLQKIEKGDPKVEIGLAFEAAAIVEVKLFNVESGDHHTLDYQLKSASEKLTLLPKRARKRSSEVKDDF